MSRLTLSFKGRVLRIFPVHQGLMHIGSNEDCDIVIDSLAVEPQHATIETQGSQSKLNDLGSESGTFVNQNKIKSYDLESNDLIKVGKHTLTFTLEEVTHLEMNESSTSIDVSPIIEKMVSEEIPAKKESTPAVESAQAPQHGWLQILNGQNLGKTISLGRSMTNIGKPGVATAVITKRGGGYFISHLEGKISPQVDNNDIGEHATELADGATIQIGNIRMQFYLE